MTRDTASGALVLGLSIHGLAVCRALAKSGVATSALAAEKHPANFTRYADVRIDPDVNSDSVCELLRRHGPDYVRNGQKCVLLPTNDTMVRAIGQGWDTLRDSYRLSWSATIDRVLDLQRKDRLISIAEDAKVRHPLSVIVSSADDVGVIRAGPGFPCIVKPARPLSGFKVSYLSCEAEFTEKASGWSADFPLVAQSWIDGDDNDLFFYSAFWQSGREIAAMTGRKRLSEPPAMGQGTIMETADVPQVKTLGRRFVEAAEVDGPISVEFKRGADGEFSLIEPNVGRSEYCVDLLIQSGFNLPLIEYSIAAGVELSPVTHGFERVCWYDTERDPLVYARDAFRARSFRPRGNRPVFPFVGHRDLRPVVAVFGRTLRRAAGWALRRGMGLMRGLLRSSQKPLDDVKGPSS